MTRIRIKLAHEDPRCQCLPEEAHECAACGAPIHAGTDCPAWAPRVELVAWRTPPTGNVTPYCAPCWNATKRAAKTRPDETHLDARGVNMRAKKVLSSGGPA